MEEPRNETKWVLLSYRLPREPSTARISVWRKLRKLGVVQIGDGLVALPHDARTKELLEWIAASVLEADGEATVWVAVPGSRRDTERLVQEMSLARDEEYRAFVDEADALSAGAVDGRTLAKMRRTLRDINRRDYFRAPLREQARQSAKRLGVTSKEVSR